MKRRLFTILAACSLLLFAALVVLWLRSYWIADHLQWTDRRMERSTYAERYFTTISSRGGLSISLILYRTQQSLVRNEIVQRYTASGESEWRYYRLAPRTLAVHGKRRLGFVYHALDHGSRNARLDRLREFVIPHWALAALSAITPSLWLTRRLRTPRSNANLCPHCHYDLRATPHRCPECGATPAGKS